MVVGYASIKYSRPQQHCFWVFMKDFSHSWNQTWKFRQGHDPQLPGKWRSEWLALFSFFVDKSIRLHAHDMARLHTIKLKGPRWHWVQKRVSWSRRALLNRIQTTVRLISLTRHTGRISAESQIIARCPWRHGDVIVIDAVWPKSVHTFVWTLFGLASWWWLIGDYRREADAVAIMTNLCKKNCSLTTC